jgi:hypothetical protein
MDKLILSPLSLLCDKAIPICIKDFHPPLVGFYVPCYFLSKWIYPF